MNLKAREILDSRGNPTVEVDMSDGGFFVRASVASGASAGKYEALELRDGDKSRYGGKGVQKAVRNISEIIAPAIKDFPLGKQKEFDEKLIEIDGTENKNKLGANAILPVSLAYAKLSAAAQNIPLYKYIAGLCGVDIGRSPILLFNVINGGAHAPGGPDLQEYQIVPQVSSVAESMRIGSEIYHKLKEIIKKEIGPMSANIGDEGGFVPAVKNNIEPLELIMKAASALGYESKIKIGLDAAASEFYKDGKYIISAEGGSASGGKEGEFDGAGLLKFYEEMASRFPFSHIEDPFEEESFDDFAKITEKFRGKIAIVGDDLTVTNIKKIKTAEEKKSCDAVIIKLNQIGTVWETLEAMRLAKSYGWKTIVSHRSGETEDTFIADLAFGAGADMIKTGAPARGERVAKYNQLLRIEEEMKNSD